MLKRKIKTESEYVFGYVKSLSNALARHTSPNFFMINIYVLLFHIAIFHTSKSDN